MEIASQQEEIPREDELDEEGVSMKEEREERWREENEGVEGGMSKEDARKWYKVRTVPSSHPSLLHCCRIASIRVRLT